MTTSRRRESGVEGANSDVAASAILEALVTRFGLAGVVWLLTEIANRRSEVLFLSGHDLKAAMSTRDAKTLDLVARALEGD
jgi:hypothetical protein